MDDTRSEKTGQERKPQQERKHPDEWREDLEPNRMAGQNIGPTSTDRERPLPTAWDLKPLHEILPDFTDDELRQIPVLREGERLQQGATYVDINDPKREEIKAMGTMQVESGHYIVPKDRVPYTLWNRLIGEEKPPR